MLRRYAAIGAVSLLVLAGCSDGGESEPRRSPAPSTPKSAAPSPSPRAAFDPPTRFGPQGAALPAEASENTIGGGDAPVRPLPVTLHRTTAFIASTTALLAVDTITGRTLATIAPTAGTTQAPTGTTPGGTDPARTDAARAPLVWTDNGRATVLATFVVDRPAKGTQKAGRAIEIVAVDAETVKSLWTAQVEAPAGLDQGYAGLAADPIGVDAGTLAVGVTYQTAQGVVAVDLATKQARWSRADFRPGVVTSGVVVGATGDPLSDPSSVLALDLADGKQKWSALPGSQQLIVSSVGPALLIATGKNYGSGDTLVASLDVATGKVRDRSAADYSSVRCQFDGKDVTVCGRSGWAVGLDSTTGKTLWELPDRAGTRVAPRIAAAWHGAVYGTTDNGPVVLDARSGKDREIAPGLAPLVVNEYVGIGLPPNGGEGVRAYPAAQ
ncbi:PQQ-binding-like beta-propeller repeat protein [Cryptosporangium sp. NPDC051539]|uniref:outer membrane protein assembly factor BamB family protein n=1 Tax=Cryptosporangium sp. NPDC051539 TaxID=3363962 RepID=UPI0037BD81EF